MSRVPFMQPFPSLMAARPGAARGRGRGWRIVPLLLVAIGPLAAPPAFATQGAPPVALAAAIEASLAAPPPIQIDAQPLRSNGLRLIYEARAYDPLWVTAMGTDDRRLRPVAEVFADAATEGLEPQWYHAEAIRRRLGTSNPQEMVDLELLLSDATLRYAEHQTRGASPPARGDPEMAFEQPTLDAPATVSAIANSSDPAADLRQLAPGHEEYRRLRSALAVYRQIEKDGGWPLIPDGKTLRVGMSGPAVRLVRRRLAITGELDPAATHSLTYDADLSIAVRNFQQHNGLEADGALGAGTRAALNVPVSGRIDQIIVNMERWRWLEPPLGERHVKVNVPAFTLDLVDGGETVLTMPVIVGKATYRTPVFSSEIRELVFNPSWYVPPRIAREEIFPKAQRDAAYLSRQGYTLRRVPVRSAATADDGDPVPTTQEVTRLRQEPGPQNPLGRVKFNLPNVFGVYLHDTPSRSTFARSNRALSHGCVRLGKAVALADALMMHADGWEERRKRLLSTWDTRTVTLQTPVPVYVLYETAWSDKAGRLHFRPDLYGRDDTLRRQMTAGHSARSTPVAQRAPGGPALVGP